MPVTLTPTTPGVVLTPLAPPAGLRAKFDALLIDRVGDLLALVKKSIVRDGTNPELVGPLTEALASLGLSPAEFGAVTDADLATVATKDYPQLLGIAEYQLVSLAHGSYTDVDETISFGSQKHSQRGSMIATRLKSLGDRLRNQYGYGLGRLGCGAIGLDSSTRALGRSRSEI